MKNKLWTMAYRHIEKFFAAKQFCFFGIPCDASHFRFARYQVELVEIGILDPRSYLNISLPPVDTQSRFNVYKMSIRHRWRRIDVL